MLIGGFFAYPYPPPHGVEWMISIPLFTGLICLGIGFFWKTSIKKRSLFKIGGWSMFSLFWALQPNQLYQPSNDLFNGVVCAIGVYVLMYLAYHEWVSLRQNKEASSLNWIAGATFLAGIIYFTIDTGVVPGLKDWMIEGVAEQSTLMMHLFGWDAVRAGSVITYQGMPITIIFACTAIQSMVLFVGMIGALPQVSLKRKLTGIAVTVIPIYFMNLFRNAGVVFMVGSGMTSFDVAHNIIAKTGSLLALIFLLYITFRLLPGLYDEIMGIVELPKRNGPLERLMKRIGGKKTQ